MGGILRQAQDEWGRRWMNGAGLAAFFGGCRRGRFTTEVNGAYRVLCYGFDVGFGFYRCCGLLGSGYTDARGACRYAGYWGYG